MENYKLHPFKDLDKLTINEDLENLFNKYKNTVKVLLIKNIITTSESVAILTLIREALGLPFIAHQQRDKCIDNITL